MGLQAYSQFVAAWMTFSCKGISSKSKKKKNTNEYYYTNPISIKVGTLSKNAINTQVEFVHSLERLFDRQNDKERIFRGFH